MPKVKPLDQRLSVIYIVACHLPKGSIVRWREDMSGGAKGGAKTRQWLSLQPVRYAQDFPIRLTPMILSPFPSEFAPPCFNLPRRPHRRSRQYILGGGADGGVLKPRTGISGDRSASLCILFLSCQTNLASGVTEHGYKILS